MAGEQDDPRALPWTRVGAYAICTDAAGRLLVCRLAPGYPSTGAWTLPGGGVEFGEHPDAAVIRELREETGLDGAIERVAIVSSSTFPKPSSRPGPLHAVAILYRVRITGGSLTVEVGGSTDACEWMGVPPSAPRSGYRWSTPPSIGSSAKCRGPSGRQLRGARMGRRWSGWPTPPS